MKIYPAIDIIDDQVVRLTQGDFAAVKTYSQSPLTVAKDMAARGANYLHVVDLDGAKTGSAAHTQTVNQICKQTNLKVQCGGGIRDVRYAKKMLDAGVDRIVLGSLAAKDPQTTRAIFGTVGAERVTLAVDCVWKNQEPVVAIHGWRTATALTIWQLIDRFLPLGLRRVLCTDIDRDGVEQGSNLALYTRIMERYPGLNLQASGGISTLSEISQLRQMGLESCVIGKALYENRFSLQEALEC